VRYLCEGGSFRDALYWREFMTRYTRQYTFTLHQRGIGKLTDCTAEIEHSDGSETSVTEGLLWDCGRVVDLRQDESAKPN